MAMSLAGYVRSGNWLLTGVTGILLGFSLLIVGSGFVCWRRDRLNSEAAPPMELR